MSGKARRFYAFTDCPGCGAVACHWLMEPWEPPSEPKEVIAVVTDYTGNVVREHYSAPGGNLEAYDLNTDTCDVMRVCVRCGSHWGEK